MRSAEPHQVGIVLKLLFMYTEITDDDSNR